MAIFQIAIIIFIFTLLFIIFAFSNTNKKVGVWIIVIILFTLIIGMTTMGASSQSQRTNPTFLIGQYSDSDNTNY
jgi:hypothetical protein